MYRHASSSRTASTRAPKKGRVRLGAVKPAITTSCRCAVFTSANRRSGVRTRMGCRRAWPWRLRDVSDRLLCKEFCAAALAVLAERGQLVAWQEGLEPLLALEKRQRPF